jgi:hypothetical protein
MAVVVAAGLAATGASAQEVTIRTSKAGDPVNTDLELGEIDKLEDAFVTGNAKTARTIAREILDKAATVAGSDKSAPFEHGRHPVVVVWGGGNAKGDPVLRRLILPEPAASAFALDLPGLEAGSALYEVLVSGDKRSSIVSEYTFTRQENPVLAQIPAVAEKFAGPLFGLLASVAVSPTARVVPKDDPEARVWAAASRLEVPFHRAAVKVQSRAKIPLLLDAWKEETQNLAGSLPFQKVPRSSCARQYSEDLGKKSYEVAETCADKKLSATDCLKKFDEAFTTAYDTRVKDCRPTPYAEADGKAMQVVDDAFRELVRTGRAAAIESDASMRNRPREHVSFGLGTALVLDARTKSERAKLNDAGNLIRDPIGRQMTMVMVNWSPDGYDKEAAVTQWEERVRLFGAGVLTPDPGIAVGGSFFIVRGLGLNFGYALMFNRTRPVDSEFGQPARKGDPFSLGRTGVMFVGMSVDFK